MLLVLNTHIAVDTAQKKVCERLKGDPEFHQGLVIRQGPVVKGEELERSFGHQVILEQIVERVGERFRRERQDLTREGTRLEERGGRT